MRTVHLTLDDSLVEQVDRAATVLGMTRSAFVRDTLRDALGRRHERELEQQHREGYERAPVQSGELGDWSDVQVWPD